MDVCSTDSIKLLADGITLVYHEARHVRHLVRAGYVAPIGWERLLSLPTNRTQAWRVLQEVRKDAASAQTAKDAVGKFGRRFGKSLADLQDLYSNDHWKHAAAVGGHAWRGVTAAVTRLSEAIELREVEKIERAAQSLRTSRHNNGAVRDKIGGLDTAIGVKTGKWWQ